MEAVRASTVRRRVQRWQQGRCRWADDVLVTEEPLEIRLRPAGQDEPVRVAVTMRTPGHDFELAGGFLFTEGLLDDPHQIAAITYCTDPGVDGDQQYNIVNVWLRPGVTVEPRTLQRNFYTTSSCGVCGKASLEAIHSRGACVLPQPRAAMVRPEVLATLGETLRRQQALFDRTGGLHAAALFDLDGRLLALREDVGRHNATDKLIGHFFLQGRTPLADTILMVSGRASFEIVQKAVVAGIPVVVAVSAPSSLACDAAREFGLTLIGFARGDRFNVYTGAARVGHPAATPG
ncbi:formate dehydrogenase accessory sulfurtransferase FdhD [Thermaerobacter sp. PB12/4term]|uniref:formate dehydrogenase accessory sulfurtransferase FdhD n=1 Tax=Thermaerobacter sp. PB12/4term TaxID=2293838 RepID=UPI000E3282BC|nr:formate dehydrogenase accessory sulfurtransferase FdhD [Thermaerobacter sp. PB12/4term]QIA27366.1 formate dehydrogenase accessory sulfurtransferase FdhD [Thermaerobacter sp. PB12/4term]